MPVYFKNGDDTGLDISSSVAPITNGEPLNQTTLQRTPELLRVRTQELKRAHLELEEVLSYSMGFSASIISTSVIAGTEATASVTTAGSASIVKRTLVKAGATPGSVSYSFLPDANCALQVVSAGFSSGRIVLTRAAFENFYANAPGTADLELRLAGDSIALVVDRAADVPAYAGIPLGDLGLAELTVGDERTLAGVTSPAIVTPATTYLQKFPQRVFLVISNTSGVVPADLLTQLASAQNSDSTDILTVEEAGLTSVVAAGKLNIRVTDATWAGLGGRAGHDGAAAYDTLEVVRVHSAASIAKHTGLSEASTRGGVEVSLAKDFRLTVPVGPTSVGWELYGPARTVGTESIVTEAATGHVVSRVNHPNKLVIPLVTFTGSGFSFVGGSFAPLSAAGDTNSLEGFSLPYARDSQGLVTQRLELTSATTTATGQPIMGKPVLMSVVIDVEEAFDQSSPKLEVGTTADTDSFAINFPLSGGQLGRFETNLTQAHLSVPAGMTPKASVSQLAGGAFTTGVAYVTFTYFYR